MTSGSRPRRSGKFLVISILAHVALILVATYLVVQTVMPRKQTFKPGPKAAANKSVEHKIEMVKKQKSMSAPAQMNRITTKGLSKVVLPDMPSLKTDEPTELTSMAGMGGVGTAFSGGGSGAGSGGQAGGLQLFGLREKGNGLTGTLYDLKQSNSKTPVEVDYLLSLRAFCQSWSPSNLKKFYVAPEKLNAARIWIPQIRAEEAPKAFNADQYVKPSRWVIHYQGKIRPPSDGKYRFVGQADDILLVRINRREVLDGSLPHYRPVSRWTARAKDQPPDGARGWVAGDWIDLKASQTYDMEILLGEFPGGLFNAYLAYEKEGETYRKTGDGTPIRPVFRLRDVPVPSGGPEAITNGPVWTSVASDPVPGVRP